MKKKSWKKSRKMKKNLFAGQQWRHRHREETCGHSGRRRGWDELREQHGNIYIIICEIRQPVGICCSILLLPLSLQLCDPIDSSPPGSPIPGILQARTLEWVAISFSKLCDSGSSNLVLCDTGWDAMGP